MSALWYPKALGPRPVPYSREDIARELRHCPRTRKSLRLQRSQHIPTLGAFLSSRMFDKGRDGFANALVNWTGHTQKALLLDMVTAPGTWLKAITNATNANPVVYTAAGHGASNNDIIVTGLIVGNLSANQIGLAASVTTNTFQLTTLYSALNVAGSGAYVSGGYMMNLTQPTFVADILGTRVGTDVTLAGTSSSRGIMTATSPFTWTSVAAGPNYQSVNLYDANGGSDAANRLEAFLDGKISVAINKAVTGGDTSISVRPVVAGIPNGTVLNFSNGQPVTVNATVNQGDVAITITAAGGAIPVGHTAEAIATNAGLPGTPNGANINFNIGTLYYPTLPSGLLVL